MTDKLKPIPYEWRDLVKRAVRCAKPKRGSPKWTGVMDAFAVGSTVAYQLCVEFGFDPDETKK